MKRLMVAAAVIGLGGCAVTNSAPTQLDTEDQKMAYAVGYQMGMMVRDSVGGLDQSLIQHGLRTGLDPQGKPLLSDEEMDEVGAAFQRRAQEQAEAAQAKLANENKVAGDAFRAEHARQSGVETLDSGIQLERLANGSGPHPAMDDTITAHYRGTLVDGTVFDDSNERGEPINFSLRQVIPAWQEVLPMMSVGDKWRIVVPPQMAYGDQGAGPIGPNSTLVFEIELLDVEKS
ncbi:FKBP-type peptidyl-prolyl cis-trans isomerase [Isoalcanivorax beigongshangi]|uniref:Peptidyl-prolyl cis-trans isomerase n=1 Tax=Isoalcanivorax beigongshangi TaxID=3238810 RepID=A0ABV4AEZ8_9GAMM